MDLYAYAQMGKLEALVTANGISVPRCRGYRLMKDEEPVPPEKIQEMIQQQAIEEAEDLIRIDDFPVCSAPWRSYNPTTDKRIKRYMLRGKNEDGREVSIGIRWERVHGKVRKRLKFAIKRATRRVNEQYELWNRYAGEKDVLYIHARLGSRSWTDYATREAITEQPWFLAKVDDYWDGSYCDIYARLKELPKEEPET